MSETSENDRQPLTDVQERFLGFIASHVDTKVGSLMQGVYRFTDGMQVLPIGDIVFSERKEGDENGELVTAEIAYEDLRPNRVPWLRVSFLMREDDKGQFAAFSDGDPDGEAFLVETDESAEYYDGDTLAAEIIDRFERLEEKGAIVKASVQG